AYVRLHRKGGGGPLGTFLVSAWFEELSHLPLQPVDVDGKTYRLALRFGRTYKPYTIHVAKVTHEVYPGTTINKNFQSDVRLEDPELGVAREASISMNSPLRHRHEALFQHQMAAAEGRTTFQVVQNVGWWLPYASCVVVALGMLLHFGIGLVGFLGRRGG